MNKRKEKKRNINKNIIYQKRVIPGELRNVKALTSVTPPVVEISFARERGRGTLAISLE